MGTTLTLDPDVAAKINQLRRAGGLSLKELVNGALRRGLKGFSGKPRRRKPFRTKAFHGVEPLIPNIDNVEEVISRIEGDWHK